MTTRILRTVSVLGVFAAVAALSGCSSSTPPMTVTSPDAQMASRQAMLVRGQEFSVRLPTRCGSQYAWRLAPQSADSDMAQLIERKHQQVEAGASDVLDQPAYDVFTFRATRTGEATLDFIYDSAWRIDSEPARQFTLDFSVSKPMRGQSNMQQASVTVQP